MSKIQRNTNFCDCICHFFILTKSTLNHHTKCLQIYLRKLEDQMTYHSWNP